MTNIYYNLGRKVGASINKGKWYYQSAFGSEKDAIKAELAVGRELARNIAKENKIIKDPSLQNIIDEIGDQLFRKVIDKKRKYKFYIVASPDINGFALPGGLIFLKDKLLKKIYDHKDEIAFVLAHEMMHIVFKHPMERIVADYSTNVVTKLLVKGGSLGMLAKQVLANLLKSGYSQDKEFEADEYAVRIMYSAGFNPTGAIGLLRKLESSSKNNLSIFNYFVSHPSADERIKKIESIIKKRKMKLQIQIRSEENL
ncbi:M48 family metalloprotease [candidate division KSB1 bacterium]|nr:M48 family metalloprotease [candidate division KSB1 bacterium]